MKIDPQPYSTFWNICNCLILCFPQSTFRYLFAIIPDVLPIDYCATVDSDHQVLYTNMHLSYLESVRYTIIPSFKTVAIVDWPPPAYIALKIYLLDFYNFQFQYYCNWIVVDRTHHLHPKSLNSSATDLSPKQS